MLPCVLFNKNAVDVQFSAFAGVSHTDTEETAVYTHQWEHSTAANGRWDYPNVLSGTIN